MAKKKKKNKLGAKAIFARILVVILVTAIGGVASFFGFKTYFASKFKKDKKAEIAKQLKEESKEKGRRWNDPDRKFHRDPNLS